MCKRLFYCLFKMLCGSCCPFAILLPVAARIPPLSF
nr:MAG TPA: hypothetical protein [Caudoviricetes sp.]